MTLRSFGFPLGLGNDICHIPRIYKILTSKRGPRFIERVLTDQERSRGKAKWILQCVSADSKIPSVVRHSGGKTKGHGVRRDPDLWKAAEFMAGRFAAKEATIKAHHHQKLSFHDIEIMNHVPPSPLKTRLQEDEDEEKAATVESTPDDELDNALESEKARSSGPPTVTIKTGGSGHHQSACLSISHDGNYATAVCLCFLGDLGVAAR